MNKKIILFILLLFSFFAYGNETKPRGFCFQDNVNTDQVIHYLKGISLPGDNFEKRTNKNCLKINLSDGRASLFQNYLKRRYTLTDFYTDYIYEDHKAVLPRSKKMCRLEVKSSQLENSKTNDLEISKKGKLLESRSQVIGDSTTNLTVMDGLSGFINVENDVVEITCYILGRNRYRLKVNLQVGDGQTKASGLGTTIEVQRGQSINLGQLADELKSKDTGYGVEASTKEGEAKVKVKRTKEKSHRTRSFSLKVL